MEGGQRELCELFAMWYFVPVLENRRLCMGRMCGSVEGDRKSCMSKLLTELKVYLQLAICIRCNDCI